MKYLLMLVLLCSLLFSSEDLTLEDDFLQSLDEVSEIATKTKLNIDDSPSFVTVLHSDKLLQLGADDVFEALSLVPGVQLKREASGVPVVIFRGVSQKGEVKLMVDGVTINNSYRGSIYHYLDFPIEMVERIEVIRGAGSVLYGSGAISGVVNVITKSSNKDNQSTIFVSAGEYDNNKAGAIVSTNIGELNFAIDTYYQKDDKMLDSTDRHLRDYSVGVNISDENFAFLARLKKDDIGNAYGVLGVSDKEKDSKYNKNNSFFTQLSYKDTLSKDNKFNIAVGYTRYEQHVHDEHQFIPLIKADYKENSYYSEIDITSKSLKNNELLFGIKYEKAKTLESTWSAGPKYISDPNYSRDITSMYLNDKYSVSSDFDLSAGLRYDHYSDIGDAYSPTLGLVYRLNDKIRLKSLYSHSYRAPSWVELTSNSKLDPEISDSIEAGIIYKKNQNNTLRINFYASQIKDMITKVGGSYTQNTKNKFYGSELEYIYIPTNQIELNFFASYIDARDDDGNKLAEIADILSTGSLIYKTNNGFSFGSLLKYVSSPKRADTDTRSDMSDSTIFDQTISYNFEEFKACIIIKDLFNNGTYYALPENTPGTGFDFNDGGRAIMIKAEMIF